MIVNCQNIDDQQLRVNGSFTTIFISLQKWLKRNKLVNFEVSDTSFDCEDQKVLTHCPNLLPCEIQYYRPSSGFDIRICKGHLVELFGSVPEKLYFRRLQ